MFGVGAMNAILDHCTALEELSVKRLRGLNESADPIGPGTAGSSLKSVYLKEFINGQCFRPLIVGSMEMKEKPSLRSRGFRWSTVANPCWWEKHKT
jgi:hypothetical protein